MREYQVFNFDDDINKTVILITSIEDLYFLQNEIYDELSVTYGENFTVLVDLFLRNGFSFNRFVALYFNGKENCKTIVVNPREVSDEIKFKIRSFLIKNRIIINESALSKNIIDFVMKAV